MKQAEPNVAGAVLHSPSNCPACRSIDVITTSKVHNDDAYWRCRSCGEVWNIARRREASRYGDTRRWGR